MAEKLPEKMTSLIPHSSPVVINMDACPDHIGVIGTGDFARALASRAVAHGMSVTIGSRHPEKRIANPRDDIIKQVDVVTVEECILSSQVIVVAIHPENHETLAPLAHAAQGKILVDVSNSLSSEQESHAERLAAIFPYSAVVKSLNNVSAYDLSSTDLGQTCVKVCGDYPAARHITMQLVNRLGYMAVDCGQLKAARNMEEDNRTLFPGWGHGTIVTFVLLVGWTTYAAVRYYIVRPTYTNNEPPYTWYVMFCEIFSKIFGDVAITLLALSYIPGPIAALKQLASGTKNRRFHRSLDIFLSMRKAVGLFALLLAVIHGVMFIFVMSGAHMGTWYESKSYMLKPNLTNEIEIDLDPRLNWKGQLCGLFAALAMCGMGVIGITSLRSVASSMNWREWQCIQSHFGFVVLFLSILHVSIHAGPNWYNFKPNHWPMRKMTHTAFFSILLPVLALIMKVIILMPCIYIPVQKIRRGWERGEKPVVFASGVGRNSSAVYPKHELPTPHTSGVDRKFRSLTAVHPKPGQPAQDITTRL